MAGGVLDESRQAKVDACILNHQEFGDIRDLLEIAASMVGSSTDAVKVRVAVAASCKTSSVPVSVAFVSLSSSGVSNEARKMSSGKRTNG